MKKITRREFIKDSIGASAFLSVSFLGLPKVLGEVPAPTSPLDLAVISNGKPGIMVRKSIELLGGIKKFVSRGDIVVVKPNIGWDRNPEQAANTNPEVVAEIIKLCLEAGAKKVKIFDRSCNTASRCYKNSGIEKAAKEAGAEVTNTVESGFVWMRFPKGETLKSWVMYKPAMEADVLINVPIAKQHGLSRVTLGMKNLMGIMGQDRGEIHQNFDAKIADVANFVRPQLTILDAVRILTNNGPMGGSLKDVKNLNTIIAGTDIATMDAYGATLFNIEPEELPFIVNANKLGLGEINLEKLNIKKVSLS
jgi:uncharacterized protein (DUF362 family)